VEKEKIVLKWGSDSVTNNVGMDARVVNDAANEIASIQSRYDAVVVSSGAVAVGKTLEFPFNDRQLAQETPSLQSYAMMGAGQWFATWQNALSRHNVASGQLLVTHNEIDNVVEKPVLQDALVDCFKWGIVPVVNENDALSVEELAKLVYGGDNDGIAGHIAELIKANAMIIYNGKGGLMDDNWEEVKRLTPSRYKWARELVEHRERREPKDVGDKGTGGMSSKLKVCIDAASLGIKTHIAKVGTPIEGVLNGDSGTEIVAIEA
jgi:glutamate 5-kinase